MKTRIACLTAVVLIAVITSTSQAAIVTIAETNFDEDPESSTPVPFDNALPTGIASLSDITSNNGRFSGVRDGGTTVTSGAEQMLKGLLSNSGDSPLTEGYFFDFTIDAGYAATSLEIDYDAWTNQGGDSLIIASYSTDGGTTWIDLLSVSTTVDEDWDSYNGSASGLSLTGTVDIRLVAEQPINSQYNVDDIVLTADVVPEPATMSLLVLGGLAMLRRRRSA